jgi:hypothetical protein
MTNKTKTTLGVGEVDTDFKFDKVSVAYPEAGKYFNKKDNEPVWVLHPPGVEQFMDEIVFFKREDDPKIYKLSPKEFQKEYEMRAS